MKTAMRLTNVLSWVNLVCWSIICAIGILMGLASGFFVMVMSAFLYSSIALHSYAALQLHKSIRDPGRPLERNTAIGIRVIGYLALFFGFLCLASGLTLFQHPIQAADMSQKTMSELKITERQIQAIVRATGVLALLLGLAVVLNVMLNFRLLRWYMLMKQNEDQP